LALGKPYNSKEKKGSIFRKKVICWNKLALSAKGKKRTPGERRGRDYVLKQTFRARREGGRTICWRGGKLGRGAYEQGEKDPGGPMSVFNPVFGRT